VTQTTNIGLKKIDGSENWRQIFDYHNDSADKTDSSVAAVQDGLAIVANGNTHAAVAEGQFVYVRNHSTLAEGLYKASSAIGTNAALSTSNLTADGSGGLNDLQEQVTSLNSNLQNVSTFDNLGSFSTLQELATLLNTKQSSMAGHTQAAIEVTASASVGVFAAGLYQGFLYKPASNNYARTMLFSAVSSKTAIGVKDAGNWIFGEVNITTN